MVVHVSNPAAACAVGMRIIHNAKADKVRKRQKPIGFLLNVTCSESYDTRIPEAPRAA
jgi:hypothetical protein